MGPLAKRHSQLGPTGHPARYSGAVALERSKSGVALAAFGRSANRGLNTRRVTDPPFEYERFGQSEGLLG